MCRAAADAHCRDQVLQRQQDHFCACCFRQFQCWVCTSEDQPHALAGLRWEQRRGELRVEIQSSTLRQLLEEAPEVTTGMFHHLSFWDLSAELVDGDVATTGISCERLRVALRGGNKFAVDGAMSAAALKFEKIETEVDPTVSGADADDVVNWDDDILPKTNSAKSIASKPPEPSAAVEGEASACVVEIMDEVMASAPGLKSIFDHDSDETSSGEDGGGEDEPFEAPPTPVLVDPVGPEAASSSGADPLAPTLADPLAPMSNADVLARLDGIAKEVNTIAELIVFSPGYSMTPSWHVVKDGEPIANIRCIDGSSFVAS